MLQEQARKVVAEAKRKRLWIYDPKTNKWYSPEEFEHIFHFDTAEEGFFKNLQVRHPADGIKAGFQRLTEIQDKLQALAKMVIDYYKK